MAAVGEGGSRRKIEAIEQKGGRRRENRGAEADAAEAVASMNLKRYGLRSRDDDLRAY